jgi:hypothetical protein
MCPDGAKVKVFVRLDGGPFVTDVEGVFDHEQVEVLEVFDVHVVPSAGPFADIRNFFATQGSPISCVEC